MELQGRLNRVMAVVKVRGSAHSNELRQYEITGDGLSIGAPVVEYAGLLTGRPLRTAALVFTTAQATITWAWASTPAWAL